MIKMAREDNHEHGLSRLLVTETTDDDRASLSDTNAEIVYVAEETYEDGWVCRRICWRPSHLAGSPKKDQVTYCTPIVWYHLSDKEIK